MSLDLTFGAGLLLSCAIAILASKFATKRSRYPLPPGPYGLPLLGNALQMPTSHEWLTFAAWGKAFGGVIHVSIFGRPIIILNSRKAISDLLEAKSGIYSDRPVLPMAGELVGYDASLPLIRYGARHREYRKLMYSGLALQKIEEIHPIQEQKIRDFLQSLLESPNQFQTHIRRTVASIVFQISHGYSVTKDDDPLVQLAERATHEFSLASAPGSFFVDLLPILKYIPDWFPGATFKKTAKAWRQTMVQLRDEPYKSVKDQVLRGVALPSFTASLVERNAQPTEEEEDIYKWTSTAFYSGGADTTVSAISTFFLAMVLNPEAQRKAQDELGKVLGRGRLPTFGDRDRLPYIEALIKEIYRWNPVAPLALPHRLTQDDVYDGFFLPEGAIVFANTWGIFHDPDIYPSHADFIPERFLSPENSDVNPDPRPFAFGYGRRVCPGKHLADASLFMLVASTLSMFKISPAKDKNEMPIIPVPNYQPGVISHPADFKCCITPRYSEAELFMQLGK
ncbi:cytochrome P450 [Collybia nuda]|uniref:Cytochrome P450 n=1 Tax=Collybia nuda TaxID=64659 RepID=A0A9P5XVW5_9AGAR|nr:cytochrome P450 [Collybia nuda]